MAEVTPGMKSLVGIPRVLGFCDNNKKTQKMERKRKKKKEMGYLWRA